MVWSRWKRKGDVRKEGVYGLKEKEKMDICRNQEETEIKRGKRQEGVEKA